MSYQSMMRDVITIILLLLCFVFPIQIYVMGAGLGAGIEGAFYQYKSTGFGNSLLPITTDIDYIIQDIYNGKTMISVIFWVIGSIFIIIATIFWLIMEYKSILFRRIAGIFLIFSGVLYLLSIIFQYGLLLYGPAGMSFPLGVPILFSLGIIILKL